MAKRSLWSVAAGALKNFVEDAEYLSTQTEEELLKIKNAATYQISKKVP